MSFEICEVGPRDGLQSFGIQLSIEQRLRFIEELLAAGLRKIEVGALVHPKYVPEMAESDLVFRGVLERFSKLPTQNFSLLLPNQMALDKALELGCKSVAFFTATSESFNQKNIKKSVAESVTLIKEMILQIQKLNAKQNNANDKILVRVYISTVFHCPYEGKREVKNSLLPFRELIDLCDEVSLGDTTGNGEVEQLAQLHQETEKFREKIWWHFHDTYNKAEALTKEAIALGYKKYDSSTGGIGGCPFAPGARGNIATEKLLQIIEQTGAQLKIDRVKLAEIGSGIVSLKK